MAKANKVEIRIEDETLERWRDGAQAAGLTMSMFVRQCVEDTLELGGLIDQQQPVKRTRTAVPKQIVPADLPPQTAAGKAMADAVQDAVTKASAPPVGTRTKVSPPPKRKRTSMCPHRRGPDQFCSRCDAS